MSLSRDELVACYERLESPLYNALFRLLWHAQDCQDVMHDACLRVWDRRDHVDGARVDALVWRSALNLARNKLRWKALWRFTTHDDDMASDDDPARAAEQTAQNQRLRAALARLPTAMREVVVLAEFGGLGVAEIAAVLDIPQGTVGSRRHHAVARLREQMKVMKNER